MLNKEPQRECKNSDAQRRQIETDGFYMNLPPGKGAELHNSMAVITFMSLIVCKNTKNQF